VSAATILPENPAGFFRFPQADVCGRGAVSERWVVFSDLGACDINRNLFEELFVMVRSMPYIKRPHGEEDKSALYGTLGFIVFGAVIVILSYVFGWI